MRQMHIPRRLILSVSLAAAVAVAGLSASAQTTTTTSTACATSPNATDKASAGDLTTAIKAPKGGAMPDMMQEACQRQRARTAKFLQCGIPEMFGSEEPFKFDPAAPCR